MSLRRRTTKLLARRHDLNYFKHLSPIRAWQWWLALICLGVSVVWIGEASFLHGNTEFSAGPMSTSHAVFGRKCAVCHVPAVGATRLTPAFAMRRKVPDSACLQCHQVGPHHAGASAETPACGTCHQEHIGATHLAAVTDNNCASCHADLHTQSGMLQVAAHVRSFAGEHPEFRPLRDATPAQHDADFALRFNHAEHLAPNLSMPNGGKTTLECSSCHMPALDAKGAPNGTIAPVDFDRSCRTCHSLEFDNHIAQQAPHAAPDVVRAFVEQALARSGGAAVESAQFTRASLTEPSPPSHSTRVEKAETILFREKCGLCHAQLNGAVYQPGVLPQYEPVAQPAKWFPAAVFSHTAHQAVACAECHTKALTSQNGSDVLMPSIATCRRCHDGQSHPQGPAPTAGHAESGCFLCHVYHAPAGQPHLRNSGYTINELLGK